MSALTTDRSLQDRFTDYRAALDVADECAGQMRGRRVRWLWLGEPTEHTGRIVRVYPGGIKVKWDPGSSFDDRLFAADELELLR